MEQKQIATKMNKDNLRNVCRTGPCAQVKKVVQTLYFSAFVLLGQNNLFQNSACRVCLTDSQTKDSAPN